MRMVAEWVAWEECIKHFYLLSRIPSEEEGIFKYFIQTKVSDARRQAG